MRTAVLFSWDAQRLLALIGTVALLGAACAPAAPPPPTAVLAPAKPAATTAPAAAAPTTPAGAAPAAAKPASGEPIKIGYVWGVTGAVAEIVRPASEATKAFWDDLNKKGGIKGHPVQMVEIDDKYQVPLAQEGYKKVTTDDKVPIVVLASTGDTEALAPQIATDKIVAITLSCDEKWSMPEKNPSIFTVCTTYQDQMITALKFIKDKSGGKDTKVAFSYPDIPFGQAPLAVGREFSKSLGLTLVDEQKVGAADVDAQSQALNLKSTNPDYVIINNVTGGASAMVRSGKQVGLTAQFLALNYAFDEPTIKAIGQQAAEGYIGVGPNAFPGPEVGLLKDLNAGAPNLKDVTMRSIQGWAIAMVTADALNRATAYDSASILAALEKTDLDVKGAIPGSKWTYTDKSHVPTRKSVFYQVKSGKIEKITEPIDPPAR
jgi:branched-chain amino acid transport system substrate-binding protein